MRENKLKNVPSELDKSVANKELPYSDDFIFYVTLFAICVVLDKIS